MAEFDPAQARTLLNLTDRTTWWWADAQLSAALDEIDRLRARVAELNDQERGEAYLRELAAKWEGLNSPPTEVEQILRARVAQLEAEQTALREALQDTLDEFFLRWAGDSRVPAFAEIQNRLRAYYTLLAGAAQGGDSQER